MSSVIGKNIRLSIFGESHGPTIGVVVDGLPSGENISFDEILLQMDRRAPGKNRFSTTRKESDVPEIVSGFLGSVTTGAPVCALIKNRDVRPFDYDPIKNTPRPGHADFTAIRKYKGFSDISGGGHLSGRLTAPMTFAGSVCKQILEHRGIKVCASIYSIAGEKDDESMWKKIDDARKSGDSVGGIIRCEVEGVPAGVGSPVFDGVENVISHYIFGIPGVKGIEFGAGFEVANMKGSENNDEFFMDGHKVSTLTNNHGGILGGISSGMPITFRVAVKPTPSISLKQKTVDLQKKIDTDIQINGRHDPCIVPRAVVVVEAVTAIAVLDLLMDGE